MRRIVWVLAICLLGMGNWAQARQVEGVHIPERLSVGGTEFILNGAGVRSRFFFDLYVGALYLPRTSISAPKIIRADQPMLIRLHIVSKLITSDKMAEATREGFVQSTNGQTAGIQDRIQKLIAVFQQEEIEKGDVFDLIYRPDKGIETRKNGECLVRVPGLDFKKALFGIWLSDDPIQKSLKMDMLGRDG